MLNSNGPVFREEGRRRICARYMPKLENQTMLVTALRAFTGKLPPGYADEREFFLTSLENMAEYLAGLQSETLKEACDSFLRKLDAGRVTLTTVGEFKARVDTLVSVADFRAVSAGMAGSREFIRQRLAALRFVSIFAEGKKAAGRDPEAERRIKETYARLNFDKLARRVEEEPNDFAANAALAQARGEVADYCCLYRIPLTNADTLTPFSLTCVDAALAASHRLYKSIRQATGQERAG
jgi:hypothetical protein